MKIEIEVISKGDAHYIKVTRDGKTKWISYNKRERAEAAAKAIKKLADDASPVTVEEYLDRWMEHHVAVRVSPRTGKDYARTVQKHLKPHFGSRALVGITKADIQKYIADEHARGSSYRNITAKLNVFSSALGRAVEWGYIDSNPIGEIDALLLGTAHMP